MREPVLARSLTRSSFLRSLRLDIVPGRPKAAFCARGELKLDDDAVDDCEKLSGDDALMNVGGCGSVCGAGGMYTGVSYGAVGCGSGGAVSGVRTPHLLTSCADGDLVWPLPGGGDPVYVRVAHSDGRASISVFDSAGEVESRCGTLAILPCSHGGGTAGFARSRMFASEFERLILR